MTSVTDISVSEKSLDSLEAASVCFVLLVAMCGVTVKC